LIYVRIHSYKSELNNKFKSKNQLLNQKLYFLASSKINYGGKINYISEVPNMSWSILRL